MSEDIPLSLDKDKLMRYLSGDVSFEEWKDGEMLHSLMVSNPLAASSTEQVGRSTSTENKDSQHGIQGAGPSPGRSGSTVNSPRTLAPSTPMASPSDRMAGPVCGTNQSPQNSLNQPSPSRFQVPQSGGPSREPPGPNEVYEQVIPQQPHPCPPTLVGSPYQQSSLMRSPTTAFLSGRMARLGTSATQSPRSIPNQPPPSRFRVPQGGEPSRDSPCPHKRVVSQQLPPRPPSLVSSVYQQLALRRSPGPTHGRKPQPLLMHPIPSMSPGPNESQSGETIPFIQPTLGPAISQMLPPVLRGLQAGPSGQGRSHPSQGTPGSMTKTPVRGGGGYAQANVSQHTPTASKMVTPVPRDAGGAGAMSRSVSLKTQTGPSGLGQSNTSRGTACSMEKTPVREGGGYAQANPSPHNAAPYTAPRMVTPVQRDAGSTMSLFVSPKPSGPGGASQTSLGGNFVIILSDNSLAIRLPDIKKEMEMDEAEPEIEEAPVEEVETMEADSGEEGDSAGAQEGGTTSEDSTDTEIQKNVAELRKMGIKAAIPQTPIRRGKGVVKGPRVNRVPKALAGLMGEANLCFARGEYEDAATMCLEVIRQAPKCAEPYQLLSLLYEEKGEHEQSLEFAVLGAHLLSHDAEEWRRVIEMCLDQNKQDMALYCYNKAIMSTKDKVSLLREKIGLLKEMGDSQRVFTTNRMLLRYLPTENAEECLQLAREMTMSAHQNNDTKTAMQIMSEAIEKHRDHIAYEDINMMVELLMTKKDFRGAMEFLVKFCGVTLIHGKGKRRKSADAEGDDPLGLATLSEVVAPAELPVDLRASLGVCLIQLDVKQSIIQACLTPLFKEDIASFGDLYLDVAEAYTDRGNSKKARPILAQLVKSQTFNQPAVWLRYADCLNSLGDWTHAAGAYKRVLREVPAHLEARLSLATIEQQAGRTSSALELLSCDTQEGESQDVQLAYRKCLLLHNAGKYEEMADLAVGLVVQYYSRGATENMDITDDINPDQFCGDISVISHTEWYSLLVMTCRCLKSLERYQEMSDLAQMALNHEKMKEFHNRKDVDNIVFLLIFAHYFNKKFTTCYNTMRSLARQHAFNNRFMNLFSLVTSCANMSKHYRFCLRMTIKFHPDNLAFCIMNGFNTMIRGSYKHALGEFVRALREDMENPIVNMCVGLCFFHLANQKFTDKKHSIILQGFAFFKRYEKFRGVCQETYYNIGRALHGSGLAHLAVHYYHQALKMSPPIPDEQFNLQCKVWPHLAVHYYHWALVMNPPIPNKRFNLRCLTHLAVHYYHRALEMSPPIPDERFNLQCEVAHNLSLIYLQSNNKEMAAEILSKYCVI